MQDRRGSLGTAAGRPLKTEADFAVRTILKRMFDVIKLGNADIAAEVVDTVQSHEFGLW